MKSSMRKSPGGSDDGVGVGVEIPDADSDRRPRALLPPLVGVDDGSRPLVAEAQLGGDLLGDYEDYETHRAGVDTRVPTRFVLKYTLRAAHLELGGVDLDLAVEDDVLPLDRADVPQQVGVEREIRRCGQA